MGEARKGVLSIVAACAIWGFAPLYYHKLSDVPALEMLAHRTIWTGVLFGLWLIWRGRGGEVAALWPMRGRMLAAAGLIAFNWGLFIWAVAGPHAIDASLGYYIYPLASAGIGAMLGERLAPRQWAGIALAGFAVLVLTLGLGVLPLVSLALAFSFAAYAAIKQGIRAAPLVSVLAEVLLVGPPLLIWLAAHGGGAFGRDLWHTAMLPLAGPLSGVPLVLFSYGAQRVKLATSGLVQYMNPTIQFFSAWAIMGQSVTPWHGAALALIWAAIGLYASSAKAS